MSQQLYSRKSAISEILNNNEDALIVASAGYTSRALYSVKDSSKHFYMMGSMGCAVGFGIGIALNTNKNVVVIIGDGEALMSLGSIALYEKLSLDNLSIYILDNNQYQSTGGQPTCSDAKIFRDSSIYKYTIDDDRTPPRIPLKHKDIARRFYNEVNSS